MFCRIPLVFSLLAVICLASCKKDAFKVDSTKVHWATSIASLKADEFHLIADGKRFTATSPFIRVNSDPGDANYSSLELTWFENEVEMRINIYFRADGSSWWADEIRIFDGKEETDWIFFTGEFFKSSLGEKYTGELQIDSDTGSINQYSGSVHLSGLEVGAFFNL